jgi:hypothetical protein
MDGTGDWRDRHVLTDDLREAFDGAIPPQFLSLRIQRTCSLTEPLRCLELLKLHYKVPPLNPHLTQTSGPIEEVIKAQMSVYQQTFTFLVQIHWVKSLLGRMSVITQQRRRAGLHEDANIVHVVRLELLWFVNTLLNHLGVTVLLEWMC